MSKLVRLDKTYWPQGGYGHWCPGCNNGHEINVDAPNASGAKWSFDGNVVSPTFSPSINIRWGRFVDPNFKFPDGEDDSGVCHYFIRSGRIEFCGDCTHALAGKTVDLPDIPAGRYVTSERLR